MAYKAGVSCRLDLPLIIQQILYSTSSSPPPLSSSPSSISLPGKSKVAQRHQMKIKSDLFLDDFLCSAGWCLRLGITSIYPEVMRHFECLLFTCLRTNVTFLFILQLRIHFEFVYGLVFVFYTVVHYLYFKIFPMFLYLYLCLSSIPS